MAYSVKPLSIKHELEDSTEVKTRIGGTHSNVFVNLNYCSFNWASVLATVSHEHGGQYKTFKLSFFMAPDAL